MNAHERPAHERHAHERPVLELRALAAPFDPDGTADAPGLSDISVRVAAGERIAVLGPSGAGKSTLLRAIAGLAPTSRGHVLVHGADVTARAPERRDVVYLHQTPVLFPHLDVLGNVAFPLRMRGTPARDAREAAAPWLAPLGLDALATRAPSALSGGQRHRVALARALAATPRVLLLDEPLAALDPATRDDVRQAIRTAHDASDAALLLVTHDLDDALALCERLVVLIDGRIVQDATSDDVLRRPATVAVARLLGVHALLGAQPHEGGALDTAFGAVDRRLLATPVIAESAGDGAAPTGRARARHASRFTLCIRHDAVRLTLLDDDHALRARVASVTPARHGHRVVLVPAPDADAGPPADATSLPAVRNAASTDESLVAHVAGFAPPPVGADVGIRLDPRGLHLLAD